MLFLLSSSLSPPVLVFRGLSLGVSYSTVRVFLLSRARFFSLHSSFVPSCSTPPFFNVIQGDLFEMERQRALACLQKDSCGQVSFFSSSRRSGQWVGEGELFSRRLHFFSSSVQLRRFYFVFFFFLSSRKRGRETRTGKRLFFFTVSRQTVISDAAMPSGLSSSSPCGCATRTRGGPR